MGSAVIESMAAGVQVILAGTLTVVALKAHQRVPGRRMALLATAFGAFLLQGLVLSWGLLTTKVTLESAVSIGLLFNALALLIVYVGVLRP